MWPYPARRHGQGQIAEREGFEPSDGLYPVNSLAVSPIRPLSHLSFDNHSSREGGDLAASVGGGKILFYYVVFRRSVARDFFEAVT